MAESEQVRLFVAVTVPEGVKSKMEEAQAELRRAAPERGVRWARREQFHLTLRFLGDVEAERVEALGEALRTACKAFGPLHLRAERVGFFPDARYPRVVWVGVSDEAAHLPRLQQAVEAATEGFTSEAKEKRFTGHVTLARIKGLRRPEAEALGQAAASMADRLFGQWTAYQLELVRSELLPEGAQHTTVAAIALSELPADLA
jgi:RNA 2',3'-cyclic 3'-phosphodiesterase